MGTEIVNWEEKLRNESKAIAKNERAQVSKINLRGGIMMQGDREIPNNQLDCIVVDYIHENMFFKDAYDPNVIKAPDCFAYSVDGENMVPHEAIKEPQSANCHDCWANQFRTSGMSSPTDTPTGRKGKACGVDRRKLLVIPYYKDVADVARAEMAVISIPYMSVKNWSNHVNALSANPTIQRPPYGVVTRVSVKPDIKSQFKVMFDFVSNLPDEFLAAVHGKIEMARNILLTPYDQTPGAYDKKEPASAPSGKKSKF